jgi:HlyD family secretion protein
MKRLILLLLPLTISCSRSGHTVKPVRKDIIETVYASGKIIPENEYHVYALSNGTIVEKAVKEGDDVIAGSILYKVDNAAPSARLNAAKSLLQNSQSNVSDQSRVLNDIKLSMESAEAKFRNDSINYFRLKTLADQDATSKSAVDNAFTAYTISLNQKKSAEEKYYATRNDLDVALQNAKSQVTAAQSELNNYFIKSEAAGTVFQLMKEAGEAVRAGEVVALLGEKSKRIIRLAVDQQDISKIKTGQDVLLKTDVSGNTVYHATVSRLYPVMNESDQTFRVDAVFSDTVQQPFVHSSVEANIIIQQKKNALIIPRSAMVSEDSVQVKQDGKTKNIFVQTGITTLDDVEILKGLDESAEVIVSNQK